MSKRLNERSAAEYLGCSARSLRRYRKQGIGPNFVRLGGRIHYAPAALDAFAQLCEVDPLLTDVNLAASSGQTRPDEAKRGQG